VRRTRLLGVRGVIVGGIEVEEDDDGKIAGLIVSARLRKVEAGRCGICRRRSGQYHRDPGPRRWRALDLGVIPTYIEAEVPRVRCKDHGVVVCSVPWAGRTCSGWLHEHPGCDPPTPHQCGLAHSAGDAASRRSHSSRHVTLGTAARPASWLAPPR